MAMDCYQGQNEHQKMVASSDLFLATSNKASQHTGMFSLTHHQSQTCMALQPITGHEKISIHRHLWQPSFDAHFIGSQHMETSTHPDQTTLSNSVSDAAKHGHHELIISASNCHFWINVTKLSSSPSLAPRYSRTICHTQVITSLEVQVPSPWAMVLPWH